jgi:hypothetical protein
VCGRRVECVRIFFPCEEPSYVSKKNQVEIKTRSLLRKMMSPDYKGRNRFTGKMQKKKKIK